MTQSFYITQLGNYIRQGKAQEMCDYLSTLRATSLRTASQALGSGDLWRNAADFWHFASVLVSADNRAYLGTMLKAATASGHLVPTAEFAKACTTEIDRKKVLEALLPFCKGPEEASSLLHFFPLENATATELLLFRTGTSTAYFLLFNRLKAYEDNPQLLRRYGVELIRKGDKRSFNLACIVKEYFALPDLPGTFSLSLQPYELSRLDKSYEAFVNILIK